MLCKTVGQVLAALATLGTVNDIVSLPVVFHLAPFTIVALALVSVLFSWAGMNKDGS